MFALSRLWWKLRHGWRKASLDRELDEEMRFHLDMLEQEAGPDARREFGNVTQLKEASRAHWSWPSLETFLLDLRFAFRCFRRDWSSNTAAAGALSLGIGFSIAVFTIVNAILLQPLPYRNPDRLVMVWAVNKQQGWDQEKMPVPELLQWQRSGLFESMVGFVPNMTSITGPGEATLTHGYAVTPGFLQTLGMQPMIGRAFSADEERKGGEKNRILLRHSFWMRRFGGDPNVVGQRILIEDKPYIVVGVMGPEFQFFNRQTDLYVPADWSPADIQHRGRMVRVIARLKDGISLEQAQSRANVIAEQMAHDFPQSNRGWTTQLSPVKSDTTGPVRPALLVLLSSVGMVLLIACVNVTNLLLAQGVARSKEVGLRLALGADRGRIIRQLLTESLVLAALSGGAGYAIALLAVNYFRGTLPAQYSFGRFLIQMERIQIDASVAIFAAVVVPLVAVLIGLFPAWRNSRADFNESLKDTGRTAGASVGARRLQSMLVAGELAIAVVLVIGAALLARSFERLYQQGPGFQSGKLKSLYIALPTYESQIRNMEDAQRVSRALYDRTMSAVAATPGVQAVASVGHLPLAGFYYLSNFIIEGAESTSEDQAQAIDRYVSNSYHRTMRVALREGRYLEDFDRPESLRVVVVNEQFARRYLQGKPAVGRRLRYGPNAPWHTVVGVVAGEPAGGMEEEPKPMIYFSMNQSPGSLFHLIVKTDLDLPATVKLVTTTLHQISPKIAPYEVRTLDDMVLDSTWRVRYSMMMMTAMSMIALILASLGVYSVLSYAVNKRTREIGVRMALGAGRGDILAMITRDGLRLAAIGIGSGLLAACLLTRFLSTILFGVRAVDPLIFSTVGAVLALVVIVTCLLPARRAAALSPSAALRDE
ncbi:MAG: ABC transporter permease [Bryobacteraceae bacterium]